MAATSGRTNWFAVWTTVAAVVVAVAVIGALIWINDGIAAEPGATPTPTATAVGGADVDADAGAIVFGSGKQTVDTYLDFMCPYCKEFERAEGPTLEKLVMDGVITLRIHPISILDRASQGTQYSTRAASAMFAVAIADPLHAYTYFTALFANQPAEGTPGLSDDQLVEAARLAGAEVTPELEAAIRGHSYAGYVSSLTLPEGARGTPTVVVNGGEPFSPPPPYDPAADIIARLR